MKVNKNTLLQVSLIVLIVLAVIGFSIAIFSLLQSSSNNNSPENSSTNSNIDDPNANSGSGDPNNTNNSEISNPLNGQVNPEYTTLTQEQRYVLLESTLANSGYDATNTLLADLVASASSSSEQSDLCRYLASLLYLAKNESHNSRILELAYMADGINPTYTTASTIVNYESYIGSPERAEEYTIIAQERQANKSPEKPLTEYYGENQ